MNPPTPVTSTRRPDQAFAFSSALNPATEQAMYSLA
jgi:hypothetical protein